MTEKNKTLLLPLIRGITIDGDKSKDLDDGILLRDLGKGKYMLDVCIAHVVDFTPRGERLYQRAYDRVVTLYHAMGNTPMLPRSLSEDEASLLPGKPRKAILFRIPINKDTLEIGEVTIKEVRFSSKSKMTYEQVESIVRDEPHDKNNGLPYPLVSMIKKLDRLAQKLMAFRRESGALAIYDINKGWRTNEEGMLIPISDKDTHHAQIIIQECMILTNRLAAEYLQKQGLPFIVRNHTAKVTQFSLTGLVKQYEHFLQATPDEAVNLLPQVRAMCNVQMNRATYGVKSVGHVGLSLPLYAHFTSPIRRFADLINQYVLLSHLRDEEQKFAYDELVEISDYITERLESMRDKVSNSYKNKWDKHVDYLIEKQKPFPELTKKEISKVITKSFTNIPLFHEINESVTDYLIQGKLETLDLYKILFAKVGDEKFITLQLHVVLYITKNPYLARSVVEIAQSLQQISNLTMHATTENQNPFTFATHCSYVYQKEVYKLEPVYSSNKKVGEQMVSIIILTKIADLPLPTIEHALPKPKAKVELLLPEVVNDDYVSAVHMIAQKNNLQNPTCIFSPAGDGIFTATMSIQWKDKPIETKGFALGKKPAKNLAAKQLYEKLKTTIGVHV